MKIKFKMQKYTIQQVFSDIVAFFNEKLREKKEYTRAYENPAWQKEADLEKMGFDQKELMLNG